MNYIITIARGFGSGGKDIGKRLSKELNIPCYEKEILEMASEYSGINKDYFMAIDEKKRGSFLVNALKKFDSNYTLEPSDRKFVSDDNLYKIQADVIYKLAQTQSCIIIGKCANYILKDFKNVIRVYIEAPRLSCVDSIMYKMQVSAEEANRLITTTDKYRANYYRYYTNGEDWTNPTAYDMTLNSASIGRDNCVKIIQDFVNMKFIEKK